jgi:hypothetical protein
VRYEFLTADERDESVRQRRQELARDLERELKALERRHWALELDKWNAANFDPPDWERIDSAQAQQLELDAVHASARARLEAMKGGGQAEAPLLDIEPAA